ncbi:lipoprotein-releasing ABC transporter permease subunit [Brevundimonas lutea]|uniref:lipoprotein-releasing ABC transporter permease subunit n=1 Tax=Brevundimonas lutea TaxID=2293980 RepID=UPI000F016A92|nr:lipoprotein-releasing ABC transporter permease subunit [Brevundimonas lutea]
MNAFSSWELGLALRYLRARRKEGGVALIAIISFVGIMLAVAVLISVMSIMSGFRAELLGRILSFNGHMFVSGEVLQAPDRDQVVERLRNAPGVVEVSPLTESYSVIRAGAQLTPVVVRGIRAEDLRRMDLVADSTQPEALQTFGQGPYGGDRVIIGQTMANNLGLRIGDPITVLSPTGGGSAFGSLGLEKTYIVGGTFTAGMADYDAGFMFMPLEQAQIFFGKEGVWDVIEMKVDDPDRVAEIAPGVREAVGPYAVVTDWTQRASAFWEALKIERVAMSIILGLVVAIAAMNIISGIVMLVKNKTRDIAILRTVGASQSSILRVFFMAGASIGVAGTLAGLILGVLFCLNIGPIQGAVEAITGAQVFNSEVYLLPRVPALIDPVDVFWVAMLSLVMSCLASLPPSWRASRLDPVEALRFE